MKRQMISTEVYEIYVAGDVEDAKRICRRYCFDEGLCVTVSPTTFIYTGGEESGVVVGLRAYPRFPETPIYTHAHELAARLIDGLSQWSAMVVGQTNTTWITRREEP